MYIYVKLKKKKKSMSSLSKGRWCVISKINVIVCAENTHKNYLYIFFLSFDKFSSNAIENYCTLLNVQIQ